MKHAWTGGQYSLWRAALATVLCVRFVGLACAGRAMLSLLGAREPMSTAVASACAAAATIACLLLAAGAWHRVAALALAAAVVLVRDPVDSVAEPIILAALLVLVACTRPAPYLSLPAIGRADPSGSWILPDWVYACAWILLAAVLANDLWPVVSAGVWPDGAPESADVAWRWLGWVAYLAPLALPRRATRLAWIAIVAVEIWLIARGASTTARASDVVLLAGATFDPGWIAPRDAHAVEFVYYDGHCGLCHRFVRFLLAEDRRGRAFRFAPLDSESLRRRIAPDARATLPDSVVVCTHDGELFTRSRAIRRAASRLGGVWRAASIAAGAVPDAALDRIYDLVARVRHRVFARPAEACPLVPAHLRSRFEDASPRPGDVP